MIFTPALHPLLIVALGIAGVAAVVLGWRQQRRATLLWTLRLVLVLACVGLLLRPGLPGGQTQTLATDTDIVLVVDTTASIVAEDWDGDQTRLEGVKEDIAAIVEEYPGARFSLITFDKTAQVRLPLTTDTTALASSLEILIPEITRNSAGSSVGVAAQTLEDALRDAAEGSPERARMVFYFGDGEQTSGDEPESFAGSAEFVDGGAVFGYGTAEGGPMRETSGSVDGAPGEYIEYQGETAMSVIDEQNLEAIAGQLGVAYEHREADAPPTLPDAPTSTTTFSEAGEVGSTIELYRIFAIILALLLAFEIARATALLVRMRRQVEPRASTKGSP